MLSHEVNLQLLQPFTRSILVFIENWGRISFPNFFLLFEKRISINEKQKDLQRFSFCFCLPFWISVCFYGSWLAPWKFDVEFWGCEWTQRDVGGGNQIERSRRAGGRRCIRAHRERSKSMFSWLVSVHIFRSETEFFICAGQNIFYRFSFCRVFSARERCRHFLH